jgi:hypothetical protein
VANNERVFKNVWFQCFGILGAVFFVLFLTDANFKVYFGAASTIIGYGIWYYVTEKIDKAKK